MPEGERQATTSPHPTRRSFIRHEHLDYLDELFESYAVDLTHARPMLREVFDLDEPQAEATTEFWTRSFGRRLTAYPGFAEPRSIAAST